jgi:hypothetical protein
MRGSHDLAASAEIPNLDIVHVSHSHLWTPEVDPSNAPSTTTYLGVLPRSVVVDLRHGVVFWTLYPGTSSYPTKRPPDAVFLNNRHEYLLGPNRCV